MGIAALVIRKATTSLPFARNIAFVLQRPQWPESVPRPPARSRLGADYNTNWARTAPARLVRRAMIESITRPVIKTIAPPRVLGADRLNSLEGPVIFVANHSSHLDTSLLLSALPPRFRHRTAVAARSDYFFNKHWKAALWSLWINVIPLERDKANRQSIEFAREVLGQRWNLVIYPEGTRGEDDFAVPFRPGAAYIAVQAGVPVVPVHLEGTRRIFTPYTHKLRPGVTRVSFGEPIIPQDGEKARDLNERIENGVAVAADEGRTDWWSARRRAAEGTTPSLQGPAEVVGWRRSWVGTRRSSSRTEQSWPR